jgi:peptidyl-prolyl cis-trans isomerase B (cyclophilin B)
MLTTKLKVLSCTLIFLTCSLSLSCKPSGNYAVIETEYGNIKIKFAPDVAPNHVEHFIDLAREGFYDGLAFHRAEPGLLIQGGDPTSRNDDFRLWGKGTPDQEKIPAELSSRPFIRGTVGMARSMELNSATSQFFICLRDNPLLKGKYTIFGEVVDGIDVVERISKDPVRDPNFGTLFKKVVMKRVAIEK